MGDIAVNDEDLAFFGSAAINRDSDMFLVRDPTGPGEVTSIEVVGRAGAWRELNPIGDFTLN